MQTCLCDITGINSSHYCVEIYECVCACVRAHGGDSRNKSLLNEVMNDRNRPSFFHSSFISCSTLDYVFMSDEWTVESAHVVPNATLSAEEDEEIKVPIQKDDNSVVASADVDFFAKEVRTSQPTDDWPSDHFMVLVKASF